MLLLMLAKWIWSSHLIIKCLVFFIWLPHKNIIFLIVPPQIKAAHSSPHVPLPCSTLEKRNLVVIILFPHWCFRLFVFMTLWLTSLLRPTAFGFRIPSLSLKISSTFKLDDITLLEDTHWPPASSLAALFQRAETKLKHVCILKDLTFYQEANT